LFPELLQASPLLAAVSLLIIFPQISCSCSIYIQQLRREKAQINLLYPRDLFDASAV
jgi:hypothetical protein